VTSIRWIDNNTLITGNAGGHFVSYDCLKEKIIDKFSEKDNQILCMDYNAHLKKFLTAGKDVTIRVYDYETKKLTREIPRGDWFAPGHSNRIFSIKFTREHPNMFISGGWDSSLFIWDLRQKKYIDAMYGPNISGDSLDYKNNNI